MTARIVVYLRPDQLSWLEEEELRRASGKGRAGARSAIVREALDVKMSAESIVHAPECDMGVDCTCGVLEALRGTRGSE